MVAEDTPEALKAEIGNAAPGDRDRRRRQLEGASEVVADLGKPMPSKDGLLLLELAEGAAEVAPVVRALDDAGFAVESLDLVEPSLDDVFVAKTGQHLEGDGRRAAPARPRPRWRASAWRAGSGPTAVSSRRSARRSIRQTFRRPQLIAPIIVFPTLLLAVQTGGAGRAVDLPGFPEVNGFLDFMLAGAMIQSTLLAGNSGGIALAVDIEMGFTDRLMAAPISRFVDRARTPRRDRRARASSRRCTTSGSGSSSAPRSKRASPVR